MPVKLSPVYIFFLFLFFQLTVYAQQFSVQGSASQSGPFTYTITPDVLSQAGMATNYYPFDLRQNFTINFQLNFGTNDVDGADGFAFLLSNVCSPTLSVGNGLGVSGIANSLIVEFDTWNNLDPFNDISNDHTGIYADGMLNAGGNIMDGAAVPICLLEGCGNVEDGQWHTVSIQWEYISNLSQRITVLFDGVKRTTSTRNHIAERFLNNNIVFWSVSGSTGGSKNLQQFRVESSSNNNINACTGKNFTLTAPPLGTAYSWTGGSASATNTASYTAMSNGIITCNYTDYCGVNRSVNFNVIVNQNPVVTVNSFTACEAYPQTITATPSTAGIYTYVWTVPATFTNPGNVASFSANKAGTYSVVIYNTTTGCNSTSASGTVTITPATQPVFVQADTICKGTVAVPLPLASVNGINGTWSPAINNQTTTTYTFTPDAAVCAFTTTMKIAVNTAPEINLGSDRKICKGETILLDPKPTGDGLNYLWQDGSTAAVYNATQHGTYAVTVANSCGSATDEIKLEETVCEIFIPSAFTPNGDGLNDRFQVIGAVFVKDFTMQIFNRWGKLIYESNNPWQGWDGLLAGLQQPAGLYVYRIKFINIQTNKENFRNGDVMLIR
jgi:gliding motility-associated-like protein